MKRILFVLLPILVLLLSVASYAQLVAPGVDNTPKVGEKPPDFELPKGLNPRDTLGTKDFLGKKKVLLSFYPADFTAG
jgi:hypothetical protein